MSEPKAHVAVLIDFDSLARCASPAGEPWSPGDISAAILRYAGGVGRVTLARAYADWSRRGDDAKTVQSARVVPVLCPTGPAGEDRAPFRLTVDAIELIYAGGEPDAFVIATADGRLLPLVHALRADGADVVLVTPSAASVDDMKAEADFAATLGDVLAGAVGPASTPRASSDGEEGAEGEDVEEAEAPPTPPTRPSPRAASTPDRGVRPAFGDAPRRPQFDERPSSQGRSGDMRPGGFDGPPRRGFDAPPRGGFERGPRGSYGDAPARGGYDRPPRGGYGDGPPRGFEPAPMDFTGYDWGSFVKLIDELEHRLPFVGVRYLVNKVLGPRNCGLEDPRLKRDLINRAVDEGMIEMFEVGNLEGRGDPVTACRLDRKNSAVTNVLGGETETPTVAEARDEFEPMTPGAHTGGATLDLSGADAGATDDE